MVDRVAAEAWIRVHVEPSGPIELEHEAPWATVLRVPLADGAAWFKACAPLQAFEPRLTAALASRWPDRIPEVLAHDEERARLLLGDAGMPLPAFGDALDVWPAVLPLCAELQRGEAAHAEEHLAGGVPDRRLERLPAAYEGMVSRRLPLAPQETAALRAFAPRFAELCAELAAAGIPASIQHDDLHAANVWARDGRLAILDWGDACVSHPFHTLAETFRQLELLAGLVPGDPRFAQLRDAYLEPWGPPGDLAGTAALAIRVGLFEHALGGFRQRDATPPGPERERFDGWLAELLRRGLARVVRA
jgi:Phosphotransferase enzyme family